MPTGLWVLFVTTAVVYLGLAHRVLDRMRLTDTQALIFLGLMVAGSFVDLPLLHGEVNLSVNVGGALVPLALAIYLLTRADTTRERVRAVLAAVATAIAIRIIGSLGSFDPPANNLMDPLWLTAIVGGAMGYLAGRSRRAAFIAGSSGVVLADISHAVQVAVQGVRSDVAIGGAGVFDAVVIAGLAAVLLAEVFGESRERLQGGPRLGGDRPQALYQDDGITESSDTLSLSGEPGDHEEEDRRE